MEARAPAKAARIMAADVTRTAWPRENTIRHATRSFAPEEIPRTKGPAMGFRKKVWRR